MILELELVECSMLMVTLMKVNGLKIRNKVKENIIMQWIMINIMGIGLEIKNMEKVYINLGILI